MADAFQAGPLGVRAMLPAMGRRIRKLCKARFASLRLCATATRGQKLRQASEVHSICCISLYIYICVCVYVYVYIYIYHSINYIILHSNHSVFSTSNRIMKGCECRCARAGDFVHMQKFQGAANLIFQLII